MDVSMHVIALRSVRYSDTHSILTAYSLEGGKVSLLVATGRGREATRRRALLMPMGVVLCVVHQRPGRDISSVSDVKQALPLRSIPGNPLKQSVALFMAEVLTALLRDGQQPDEPLYRYLVWSVEALDDAKAVTMANYIICFLYGLGRTLGIEPDVSTWRAGRVFDMADGTFRDTPPLHSSWLGAEEARVVALLSRMSYANMHRFSFDRHERQSIIDTILSYFSMHLMSMSSLHSLDILRSMFD